MYILITLSYLTGSMQTHLLVPNNMKEKDEKSLQIRELYHNLIIRSLVQISCRLRGQLLQIRGGRMIGTQGNVLITIGTAPIRIYGLIITGLGTLAQLIHGMCQTLYIRLYKHSLLQGWH